MKNLVYGCGHNYIQTVKPFAFYTLIQPTALTPLSPLRCVVIMRMGEGVNQLTKLLSPDFLITDGHHITCHIHDGRIFNAKFLGDFLFMKRLGGPKN
jgi:hypothetical protein